MRLPDRIRTQELIGLSYVPARDYVSFNIPKKDGSLRPIKYPRRYALKNAQRNAREYLKDYLPIHEAACAFISGRGCRSALEPHKRNRFMLHLDMSNFFPSFTQEHVYRWIRTCSSQLSSSDITLLSYILTDDTNHVCQGCITSPWLTNTLMYRFDKYMYTYASKVLHGAYTRYADDLFISSDRPISVERVLTIVNAHLPNGVHINENKTRVIRQQSDSHDFLGMNISTYDKDIKIGWKRRHVLKVICHKAELGQLSEDDFRLWAGRLHWYESCEPALKEQHRFDVLRKEYNLNGTTVSNAEVGKSLTSN